jgi:organic radical activating enzyme
MTKQKIVRVIQTYALGNEMVVKNNAICSLPFKHIYSDNTGEYKLCCHTYLRNEFSENWNLQEHLPFEYFFSEDMERIRQMMLDGEFVPDCEPCYLKERKGIFSDRQKHTNTFRNRDDLSPRSVEIKMTLWGNYCNLQCAMCHPVHSSARTTEMKKFIPYLSDEVLENFNWKKKTSKITSKRYKELIANIVENIDLIEKITISSDGEPLLNSKMYEFLLSIPKDHAKKIDLAITTNFSETKFGKYTIDEILERFPLTTFRVSSEHIEEKYEWIRYPGNFDRLVNNIETYKEYVSMVAPTINVLNISDIEEIKLFYTCMGLRCMESGSYSVAVNRPLSCAGHSRREEFKKRYEQFDFAGPICFELNKKKYKSKIDFEKNRKDLETYLDLLSKERGDWRKVFGNL